ncbi:hypothetical protein CLV62_12323 [Dysgonomonas alginatilytica]|uniref:GLPGLI family protein n=1 Tax=Dysgonomonas alginatilytica TaxID=1605892 RepID=A0A2V3PKE2_9BACT|nr:hypothetical protein [Dysgonomonas alginatilytica]PXV61980.1 hypothetical protein CLV62_12323 [Dysgonomonas alginatilytica]
MKIKLVFLVCIFLISNASFAEKTVGSYSSSYFNKVYDIEAGEIKNGKFSVYIQVPAKSDNRTMVLIESDQIKEFNSILLQMKDKFVEWSKVAKDNNVTELSKSMDLRLPKTTICWQGSKWFFSFGQKLQPSFMILESGKHVVTLVQKVTSSSNQYIDETIYWVFADPQEIDELIAQLDFDKIKSKLEEDKNSSDLFQ